MDAWVDEYLWPRACGIPRSQQDITIDGHAGKVIECANHIEATVMAGGRLYLFQLLHSRSDARAFFDAFTVVLRPENGAAPSASPSP